VTVNIFHNVDEHFSCLFLVDRLKIYPKNMKKKLISIIPFGLLEADRFISELRDQKGVVSFDKHKGMNVVIKIFDKVSMRVFS
jgi:hypothetical protein